MRIWKPMSQVMRTFKKEVTACKSIVYLVTWWLWQLLSLTLKSSISMIFMWVIIIRIHICEHLGRSKLIIVAILTSLSAILNFQMVHIKTACPQVINDNILSPQLTFSTFAVCLDERSQFWQPFWIYWQPFWILKWPIDQLQSYMSLKTK